MLNVTFKCLMGTKGVKTEPVEKAMENYRHDANLPS